MYGSMPGNGDFMPHLAFHEPHGGLDVGPPKIVVIVPDWLGGYDNTSAPTDTKRHQPDAPARAGISLVGASGWWGPTQTSGGLSPRACSRSASTALRSRSGARARASDPGAH